MEPKKRSKKTKKSESAPETLGGLDPDTYPTHADLSRADHRLLFKLCKGKSVVEFGCGGSTLFLHQFVSKLISYDTDARWVELTRERCPAAEVIPMSVPVPQEIPPADVYFIDGPERLRAPWVHFIIERRLTKTIIVHDSRRSEPVNSLRSLLEWPHTAILDRVEYHAEGSNCLVITLRDEPVEYEDWNAAEPENRLPRLDQVQK